MSLESDGVGKIMAMPILQTRTLKLEEVRVCQVQSSRK